MLSKNLVVDVIEHSDPEQELVVVLVQVLAVFLVQELADVELRLRDPCNADSLAVAGNGGVTLLLLGFSSSRDRI